MASKKLTNKDILNAIRAEQSLEYQNAIPVAMTLDGQEVARILEDYPTHKNAFINSLTNKIGKEMFFSKLFNNPYKMLHKGLLPYGTSVEQLFMEMAERKGFNEHFSNSDTAEGDLLRPLQPNVDVCYIKQNFQYKFKTSIAQSQLRGAFNSPNGLSELLQQIVNSLSSSSNYTEFLDMKKILTNAVAGDGDNGDAIGTGLVQQLYADEECKANCMIPMGAEVDAKGLCKEIRAKAGRLTFPSTKYNLAHVNNWTAKEDLVLFITPEMEAEIDVEVLAMAFNVGMADVKVRTLLIDDLGVTPAGQEVVAILADRDIIQCWDTINQTGTFDNVERMAINYFAHKHGIMAGCKYANALVMVKGDTIQ